MKEVLLVRSGHATLPDDELRGLPVTTSLEEALREFRPHGVVVATPTAKHLEFALPAARAGAHLLLEKPVSDDLDGIAELTQVSREAGSRILVGFQLRFDPGLEELRRLLGRGDLGKVVRARVEWGEYLPHWHPWEDYRQGYAARNDLGGGVTRTLLHPFDYLAWLLGEVTEVQGFTGTLGDLELEVEDTCLANLRFASGALASVELDYLRRPGRHQLEVVGTEGVARWWAEDASLEVEVASSGSRESARSRWQPAEPFERNQLFLSEARHFLDVVVGAEPKCTLDDGARALAVALGVRASAEDGRRRRLDPSPAEAGAKTIHPREDSSRDG